MPTISIVIPAYNAARTILATLESVQKQTFSDFEIIVINDGSTDQTVELLSTVEDPRLKVFSYGNGGLPVARNRGISQSTGAFITFLDADDLWTEDKLELQLAALQQNPKAGVAYSWTCNMEENGESFQPGHQVTFEGNVYPKLLLGNFIASGSNIMVRQEAIESVGEFDPSLKSCEDWDFYLRLAACWSFVVVPKPQILYRQSSGAMSSKIDVMEKYHLMVLDRSLQTASPELQSLKNQSIAILYQYLAGLCLARVKDLSQVKLASQKLIIAIRLYPKILLDRITLRYIMKCLLMQMISPKFAKYFTRSISKTRDIEDPRLKHESY